MEDCFIDGKNKKNEIIMKYSLPLLMIIVFFTIAEVNDWRTDNEYIYSSNQYATFRCSANAIDMKGDKDVMFRKKIDHNKTICSITAGNDRVVFCDNEGCVYESIIFKDKKLLLGSPRRIIGIKDVITLKSGDMHFIALDKYGTAWAWGNNEDGEVDPASKEKWISAPRRILDGVTFVACGDYSSYAVSDNNINYWGENICDFKKYNENDINTFEFYSADALYVGRSHLIVEKDGCYYGYGSSSRGQLGIYEGHVENRTIIEINDADQVWCGRSFTAFIKSGKGYYLGDTANRLFSDKMSNTQGLKKFSNNCELIIDGDFSIKYLDKYFVIKYFDKHVEKSFDVSIIDTGICIDEYYGKKRPSNITSINIKNGEINSENNIEEDAHGTRIFGNLASLAGEESFTFLSIKALSEGSGKFTDVFSSLQLANMFNSKICNCSFAINDSKYAVAVGEMCDCDTFFCFAASNSNNPNTVYTIKNNVIYCYNKQLYKQNTFDGENFVSVNSDQRFIGKHAFADNSSLHDNSFTTSYATRILLENSNFAAMDNSYARKLLQQFED